MKNLPQVPPSNPFTIAGHIGIEDEMVVSTLKELSDDKIERIEIWALEVDSARRYCVCSNPTKHKPANRTGKNPLSGSTSSTAVDSDNPPESSSQEPTKPTEAVTSPVALRLGGGGLLGNTLECPMCLAPVNEDVSFVELRERGEAGLVRRGDDSPRSVASLNDISKPTSYRNYKTPASQRIKKAVAKPFARLKEAATTEDEKFKGKAVLKPLKRLFRRESKQSLSSDGGGEPHVRPRATEMYRAYRTEAQTPATAAGSVETLLSALSDDDDDGARRRPGLTIDESAARLRRAQKLLQRQNKHDT
ncbi:hypothetical protein F4804DRAFT_297273 [Jackrogersella minutella]|nr:hypothetical protein F4804DRAFT_297273 [Jackrogersella minutella]